MRGVLWAGACVGVLAGCGGGGSVTVATAPAPTASAPASGTSAGAAASGATGTVTAPPGEAGAAVMNTVPDPTATSALIGPAVPDGPGDPSGALPAAVVQRIQVADHGGFDRVVIEYRGGFGAWQVRYVDAVTQDPTGEVVELAGTAFLSVVVDGATFDNASQADGTVPHVAYSGPHRITTSGGNVREVADAGDFEAVMSLGIGLQRQAGLRAYRLADPSRLVIDVAH